MPRFSTALTTVFWLAFSAAAAAADRYPFPTLQTSWSGHRVMEANGLSMASKVYQTPTKMRYETEGTGGVVLGDERPPHY